MENVITRSADVMHGTACFAGTRVPVRVFFEHLEGGYNLDYFLMQFPSVKREQVLAVLEISRQCAESDAAVPASR